MRLIRRWGWLALVLLCVATFHVLAADTRLIDAAKKADKATIRALLQQRVDVNAPEPDGTTPVHWAVEADDAEAVQLLIRAGANVKAANRYGVTPLSRAAINGNAAIVEMLLNEGADPNTRVTEGETVLMIAARTGKPEPVKLLLDRGADVNAKEAWRGQTALMWAAAEGNAAVVKMLIDRGAEINVRSNGQFTAFLFAARQGQIEAARVLLDAGANVNEKLLVEPPPVRGSVPDAKPTLVDGSSALMLAVASAHYELASMLLDRGADPNADNTGWAPIHQVSIARRPGQGENPLGPLGSGKMDSLDFVRKLVAKGADVNAQMKASLPSNYTRLGSKGATTFLIAARAGDTALMRTLVELGADPLKPNDDGTTPVLAAAGVGTRAPGEDSGSEAEMLEALKLALELGGNINDVDKNGDTVMHGVGYKHMAVVAEYVLDRGARVDVWNRKNKSGWTPLMVAVGVQRGQNIRPSEPIAAIIRRELAKAGVADAR